ncbi:MAG: 23S rRNA (adenine(2503)-C(2))-methyltransferase RlmN [Clostridia bacterium]|nr:23S rRNA (adenine(2503)-C(2))-methyltransferase RlmN [Clostridia bacterium]
MKRNLKDYTLEELENMVTAELKQPKFRGKQIFTWLYRGVTDFSQMTDLSKPLREQLEETYSLGNLTVVKKYCSKLDETRRYLLQLEDGNYIESVLMKYHHGYTICISSQVGCAMGCAFCASTRGGKKRNLTAGEIVGQVMAVQRDLGERISNIVMMGIGEPLDNYDQVLKFLEIVNHPLGLNVGHRHISLSTCGLAEKIRHLADRDLQITLSVSLHATNDEKRSAIMPINRKYPIGILMDACRYYIKKTNRRISFEYTLIEGVNDGEADAAELIGLLKGMLCHVNLIPVNPTGAKGIRQGSRKSVEGFQKLLEMGGLTATIRREMGSDIQAACGQLRAQAEEDA